MKSLLTKASVLSLCLLAVGCSSNTQGENTALGAVGGALIGGGLGAALGNTTGWAVGGAVAGAVVGGVIGYNMDSTDRAQMATCMNTTPPKKTRCWKNKHTHTAYTVMPTTGAVAYNGNPNCRQYQAQVTDAQGQTKQYSGMACRQANGSWADVSKA